MADYIPAPDAEFDSWQENCVTYAAANSVTQGLDPWSTFGPFRPPRRPRTLIATAI